MFFSLCFCSQTDEKVRGPGERFCRCIYCQSLVICPFCVLLLSHSDGPGNLEDIWTLISVPRYCPWHYCSSVLLADNIRTLFCCPSKPSCQPLLCSTSEANKPYFSPGPAPPAWVGTVRVAPDSTITTSPCTIASCSLGGESPESTRSSLNAFPLGCAN